MVPIVNFWKKNFSSVALGAFFVLALFNPVFKKYDYGAGFPLVIIFSILVFVLVFVEFRKKREKVIFEKLALFVFAIFMVLSFVFSQTQNFGLSEVMAYVSVVGFYLIYGYQKIEWKGAFFKFLVVCGVLAVLLGFVLYLWRDHPRMMGPFFNTLYHAHVWPNAFALFLLMVWPIFLIAGKPGSKRLLIWRSLGIALMLAALLLTFSRGAFLAFLGQAVLVFIYFARRMNLHKILLIVLTAALAFGLFVGANYVRALRHDVIEIEERASFENSESLTSKQERLDFWYGAIELAKEKPWFGWGPFSFRQAYNPIQKTFLGSADHPHNLFLKIAAENGMVAFDGFVIFLFIVLFTLFRRFNTLKREGRDIVFVLTVAVLGAFAHNLIDYNLNFMVNLVLLFLFLAFIRSEISIKHEKSGAFLGLFIGLLLTIAALYEGTLLVLAETKDESSLEFSYFPRNYYLTTADEFIANGNFDAALPYLKRQLTLNPLDSQAWYLKGVVYCANERIDKCGESFEKALSLNPMNDLMYYYDYLKFLDEKRPAGYKTKLTELVPEIKELLEIYFDYVEENVHFTAYTKNVETAYELATVLDKYLTEEESRYFKESAEKMIETAEKLRKSKTF